MGWQYRRQLSDVVVKEGRVFLYIQVKKIENSLDITDGSHARPVLRTKTKIEIN